MGKPSAPKPPDPKETASAQTATNIGTAIAQGELNNVNQVTPEGSLTYDQTGTYDYVDPLSGQTHVIPKYTATQTYSPQQQAIFDQSKAAQLNLAGTAADQSSFLRDYLGKPVDINNESVESRLFELGRKRLDPLFADQQERLTANLANRGIKGGSDAYYKAQEAFDQRQNDAYNNLLLTGRQQGVQEALTERNQPINEITALLSGSQVSQPQFVPTGGNPIANVDYAGLVQDNYNAQLGQYNSQVAQRQQLLGGLFGLGASVIASDRRVKTDIKKVGRLDNGLSVYSYRYVWGGPVHIGVMADEVEAINPDAVVDLGAFKAVDYERAVS